MRDDAAPVANMTEALAIAERLREESVAAGDQSYGAVVLQGDRVVGAGEAQARGP